MKGSAGFREMRPLSERLAVVDRLSGFDFDHDLQPVALLQRRQEQIGIERRGTGTNGGVLLGPGIDADLETPAEFGPQLPNDAIVFQLFADRPPQNRAQRGLRELIKSRILARFLASSTAHSEACQDEARVIACKRAKSG